MRYYFKGCYGLGAGVLLSSSRRTRRDSAVDLWSLLSEQDPASAEGLLFRIDDTVLELHLHKKWDIEWTVLHRMIQCFRVGDEEGVVVVPRRPFPRELLASSAVIFSSRVTLQTPFL